MDWVMRNILLLFGVTITVILCLAFLVAVDRIAPMLGYGAIMVLVALWFPSPFSSQDVLESVSLSAHLPPLVPANRAEGVYPISEVKDVKAE